MKAILIKNDLWEYVNGTITSTTETTEKWIKNDQKACADIMLAVSPIETSLIAECETSSKMWTKLQETFQSKGSTRKATFLKRIALSRMKEGDDITTHLKEYFDAVAKLKEIEVTLGEELLSILLLHSLPSSYENFRCALESRDELPSPSTLRIKILEESESRKSVEDRNNAENVLYVKRNKNQNGANVKHINYIPKKKVEIKRNIKCFKCGKTGHYARDCYSKNYHKANKCENALCTKESVCFCPSENEQWCIDSGCTSHMSCNANIFKKMNPSNQELYLANNNSTKISGVGIVEVNVNESDIENKLTLNNVLYVSDLRTNLLSDIANK